RIDPVRFICYLSSGKIAYAIADEFARRGAEVTLVSGPVAGLKPAAANVEVRSVESALQMLDECRSAWPQADIAVMTAAVADYRVENSAAHKIKREGNEPPELKLVKNPDIAATLGAGKRPGQLLVGFALETDNETAHAADKLARKNLDAVVVNSLRDAGAGFGTDTNKVTIIAADGSITPYGLKSKREVAADIVTYIASLSK
ncbi:MAG: phosphopantothenoylcysteine decarboxylase, partial [Muribaculaceae bacterium]|nr:phosphopantothenoylcysteine decarboxylase [Muribaculaceae bacterium]